jgi:hypothetical protein
MGKETTRMKRKTTRNSDQKLDRKGLGIPLETAKTRAPHPGSKN